MFVGLFDGDSFGGTSVDEEQTFVGGAGHRSGDVGEEAVLHHELAVEVGALAGAEDVGEQIVGAVVGVGAGGHQPTLEEHVVGDGLFHHLQPVFL